MSFRYWAFKALIILSTLGLLAAGAYGCWHIDIRFDPMKLLPEDTYLKQFVHSYHTGYPFKGWPAQAFSGNVTYDLEEFEKLDYVRYI